MERANNRKLLVSVFNAQEAREAVLGGGRIIDSEDPRSALGNIKPHHIMAVSDAVLNYKRDIEVQLSTNIGEDQLLFERSELGQAIEKSAYEIAGKAAQSAIGVACAMGTRVHPCNIVKVGVDGMPVELVREVLAEVVLTLNRTEQFSHCQVMGVLFAQDMDAWNERKREREVREVLVELREFHPSDPKDEDAFDLQDYAVNTLRDRDGQIIFHKKEEVTLDSLKKHNVLPQEAEHTFIALNELFPHKTYFPDIAVGNRTTKEVIKVMVDATAEAGADAIMLDTQIQTKVARISLVDTAGKGMIDINRFDIPSNPKLTRRGILTLEELQFFVDYCHYKGIEANVAGSVESYQAQQLWVSIPQLDHISVRGAGSAVERNPYSSNGGGLDTRQHRVIKRHLVRGLAPPEHGGVLNFPVAMRTNPDAVATIGELRKLIAERRKQQDLPDLETFFVNKYGEPQPADAATPPPLASVRPLSQEGRVPCSFPELPTDKDIATQRNANWQKGLLGQSEWIWSGHLNFAPFPNNLGRFFLLIPGVFEQQLHFSTSLIFDEPSFRNGVQISGFLDRPAKELVINLIAQKRRSWYSMTHHAVLGRLTFIRAGIDLETYTKKMVHLLDYGSAGNPGGFSEMERQMLKFADKFSGNLKEYTDKDLAALKDSLRKHNQNTFGQIERPVLQREAARVAEARALAQGKSAEDARSAARAAFDSVSAQLPADMNERKLSGQFVELSFLCMQFVALTGMFTSLNIPDESFLPDVMMQLLPDSVIEKVNQLCAAGGAGMPTSVPPAAQIPLDAILETEFDPSGNVKSGVMVHPARPLGSAVPLTSFETSKDRDLGMTQGGQEVATWGWGRGMHFPGSLVYAIQYIPEVGRYEADYSLALMFNEDQTRNGEPTGGFVDRVLKELIINKVYRHTQSRYGLEHHTMFVYVEYQRRYKVAELTDGDGQAAAALARERCTDALLRMHEHQQHPGSFSLLEDAVFTWLDEIVLRPHSAYKYEPAVRDALRKQNEQEIKAGTRILDFGAELTHEQMMSKLIDHQIAEMAMLIGHMDGVSRAFTMLRLEAEDAVHPVKGQQLPDGRVKADLDGDGCAQLTGFFNARPNFHSLLKLIADPRVLTLHELFLNPEVLDQVSERLRRGEKVIEIQSKEATKTAYF